MNPPLNEARSRMGPVAMALALALVAGSWCLPAYAADADVERVRATTTKLINMLLEQGLITRAKADELLKEMDAPAARPPATGAASSATPAAAPTPATTVRVPFVPEFVRKEIKDELRAELSAQARQEGWAGPGTVPAWVRGMRWEGDLRSRFQSDQYDPLNAPAIGVVETNRSRALTLTNTTEDRQRLRVRARLGLAITADSHWSGNLRLTTGSASDPVTSNQTLGNYGNRFTVAFDRASIRYRQGGNFNMVAGRFGNPWFGTDLVWDSDLAFDGVAAQWTPLVSTWGKAFFTAAAMPVQEVELSSADKWLYGVQAGMEWPGRGLVSGRVAVGYYHFSNLVGQANAAGSSLNDFTAPAFAQKGNTYFNISSDPARPLLALASDYRLVNLTGSISMVTIGYKNLVLTADYVKNLGFKAGPVSARVGTAVAAETEGYLLRASLGDEDVDAPHRWQVFFSYKNLKRDAVPDAFTDSDLRGGGTDVKGYSLGASYGVGKNTAATLRWLSGDAVSGAPLSLDSLRVDLSTRF